MRGKIHQDRQRLARRIVEPHHRQFAIAGLRLDLRMPVAIESLQLHRSHRHARRRQPRIRFHNRRHNAVFHLPVIPQRRIEASLALAFLIGQFQHRAMMRMRSRNDRILDPRLLLDARTNALQRSFRRRAPQVQPHNRDLLPPRVNHHRIRI